MWWNKTKKQEDPKLTQAVAHLEQMISDIQNPKPKGIDEAAIEGFKISEKFGQFLTKCETQIGKDAATIGVADTEDEGGVMFVHKDLEERIEQENDLDKLQLKLALANYPMPNSSYQFNKRWPNEVAKFHGLLNSEEVIGDKAVALATFVVHNLDIALNFYHHSHELKADWIFEGVYCEAEQRERIRLEEAAIWTRIVAELCPKWLLMSWSTSEGWAKLTEDQKKPIRQLAQLFVGHFYGELAFFLGVQGFTPRATWSALNDRAYEYGAYHEWFPEKDKPARDTLFWEAPKRVGELFGGSAAKNVAFIATYAGIFMERIQKAKIEELMTGLPLASEPRGAS
jgi:hypothetical protein